MNAQSSRSLSSELAQRIEAFEVALGANPSADYANFLPAPEDRLYFPLLEELIRIDLERSWAGGDGKRVADYLSRHPEVSERSVLLSAIAFEEYRQRRLAGHPASACEYRERLGLDTSDWPNPEDGSRQRSVIPIPARMERHPGSRDPASDRDGSCRVAG